MPAKKGAKNTCLSFAIDFIAKPGNASKLAAQLKEAAAVAKIHNHRILTDLTGEFNRVILEFEVENISGFEARLEDYATNAAFRFVVPR